MLRAFDELIFLPCCRLFRSVDAFRDEAWLLLLIIAASFALPRYDAAA